MKLNSYHHVHLNLSFSRKWLFHNSAPSYPYMVTENKDSMSSLNRYTNAQREASKWGIACHWRQQLVLLTLFIHTDGRRLIVQAISTWISLDICSIATIKTSRGQKHQRYIASPLVDALLAFNSYFAADESRARWWLRNMYWVLFSGIERETWNQHCPRANLKSHYNLCVLSCSREQLFSSYDG